MTGPPPASGPAPCCDLHNRNCELPSELCCEQCTEARHGGWTDERGNWRHGHPRGEECVLTAGGPAQPEAPGQAAYTVVESPNKPRPDDALTRSVADMLRRIEANYEREGSGPGSRFEGELLEDVQARAVIEAANRAGQAAYVPRLRAVLSDAPERIGAVAGEVARMIADERDALAAGSERLRAELRELAASWAEPIPMATAMHDEIIEQCQREECARALRAALEVPGA